MPAGSERGGHFQHAFRPYGFAALNLTGLCEVVPYGTCVDLGLGQLA